MTSPLVVLTQNDAARLAQLHTIADEKAWPVQDYRQFLSSSNGLGFAIVNEHNDSLAAFLLCQFTLDTADIVMVATHPDFQRRGYASALLHSLLKRLGERGVARVTLDVAADNISAISLYRKLNFEEDGRRQGYYRRAAGRVDAILMSRTVAGLLRPKKA